VNHKKLFRIYREEKLVVRKRGGRKRALGTRAPMTVPQGPNQRWSLNFVSDGLADGRCFRVLAVVEDFVRKCLALIADTLLSGARVARELDAVIARRGKPHTIVSDCVARSRPQNFRNWRWLPNRRRSPASARIVMAWIGPIPGGWRRR
jgi:putative transposase